MAENGGQRIMKLNILTLQNEGAGTYLEMSVGQETYSGILSFDEVEDLEINLTNIIKQLQDYRIRQSEKHECKWCGGIGQLATGKCQECDGNGFYTV